MNDSLESLKAYVSRKGGGGIPLSHPGVVVVGSGKGGVGTSTVSGLLALAGLRSGKRVLLVDGDEGAGCLHLLFGRPDDGPGIGVLKGGRVTPEELVVPVTDRLSLIPGGGGRADATYTAGLGEHRALFRRIAGLYDRFDLVIVDGGSHLSSVMAACSYGTRRLVAVTTGDRISVAANYALLKVAHDRFPDLRVEVLVNGQDTKFADIVFDAITSASQRFLGIPTAFAGSIPEDLHLRTGVRSGVPLQDMSNGSPAPSAATGILRRLLPDQGEASPQEQAPISLATRH
jgi:MinD-like ATPase involved in chromosome partitioning or flagellar assembly